MHECMSLISHFVPFLSLTGTNHRYTPIKEQLCVYFNIMVASKEQEAFYLLPSENKNISNLEDKI